MTMSTSSHSSPRRRARNLGILSGVLGALLLSIPVTSSAEEPAVDNSSVRYERKSGKVKSKNNLDTKFKAEQQKAERAKTQQVDMMTADQFARQKEAVAQEIADKQIEQLKRLIRASEQTDAEYPDYLFRLADHHLDKKAYFDLQAGELYEKIYEAEEQGKSAEAKQLKERQKKFERLSQGASGEAVKIYHVLVNNKAFRKFNRMDEAIYFYAFELGQLKREAEMQEAYLRLIREYPTSKYIPNAYLSFADFKFAANQIPDALRLYQKIVDGYKDSPVYAYALYKMGWCYLNPIGTAEPEYKKSLEKFVATVKATMEGRAGSEANAKQLRRDARRDMVKAYVHAGRPSAALEFFEKVGNGPKKDENMSRKMLELLAVAYFGEGMYIESSATYKTLQTQYATAPERCDWQARVVVNALATDDKDIQWKETNRLSEYWNEYKDSKFKTATKKKCRDEARDTMRQMATVWHDEAEKTRRPETYALSEEAYRAYLKYFPKDTDAYELNYYYAELLWAQATNAYNTKNRASQEIGLKKFREAHDEFVNVLERKPDGKFTKDAAFAQMLAMKNALEYDETGGKKKSCKVNTEGVCIYREKSVKKKVVDKDTETDTATDFPESNYTEDESKMLEAYDVYQKYVKDKKDKELPKIQYHRAKLMMEHNKFKDARPLLEKIVVEFDGQIYAAWAAQMLIDLLVIAWTDKDNTPEQTVKSSEDLEKWALKVQKLKLYNHDESKKLKENLPTYMAGIGWKKAEAYQEQGKAGDPEGYVKCADTYVQVYNDHETHDRADTLLFNAARCYEAAYLVGKAIRTRNILLERHTDSKHYQQTLMELGQNYQRIAFFDKAAERFEEFANKYTKDKFTPEALQNAYLFRLGLGEEAKAQEDLNKYENLYRKKDPKTAAKIYWSKHELLDSDEERLAHAREFITRYGSKGGVDREVVAQALVGQILWRQSCSKELLYDSCISVQRKKANAGEKTREKADKLRKKAKASKKKKGEDLAKFCGSATQGLVTVHARDGKKAKQAQTHFQTSLRLASRNPEIPKDEKQRIEDYKNAVGMSMVYSADEKYEEYLRNEMPEGLDFTIEDWKKGSGVPKWEKEYKEQVAKTEDSKKRFKDFFDRKVTVAKDLQERYAKVKSSGSPYWVLAAAARSAVTMQNFADQLYRAEVPKSFKVEDQVFAYCDALADQAEVPQKMANEAFTYCLERSTEFQFFNEFSRMCEEELQQRDPDKFPATNELFGTSIYTDSRLDVVGVQTSLDGEKPKAKAAPKANGKDAKKDDEGASEEGI
jgi:tetratricopeptide (TPR) repeat protein